MINTIEKPKINKNALNYIYLLANAVDKNNVLDQIELKPLDQKSFYNKAMVIKADSNDPLYKNIKYLLKSYDTIVAFITTDGEFYITGKYSPTTTKHQRSFAYYYAGLDIPAKKLTNYQI